MTPNLSFKVTVYFKGEYLENGTPRLVLGYIFGVGGSNGAISGSIKSKMAANGHLGYNFAPGLPIDVMFGSRERVSS